MNRTNRVGDHYACRQIALTLQCRTGICSVGARNIADPGKAGLLRGQANFRAQAAMLSYGLPDEAPTGGALVAADGGGVSRAISRSYSSTSRASPTFFASCSACS